MTRMTIAKGDSMKNEVSPPSVTFRELATLAPHAWVTLQPLSDASVTRKKRQVSPVKTAKYQLKLLIGGTCGTCTQLLAHTRKANKYNIKTRIKKELANKVSPVTHRRAVVAHA